VVLELAAGADAVLVLKLVQPVEQAAATKLSDLLRGSANLRTGPFPKESYQWHRLVPAAASSVAGRVTLDVPTKRSYVYLRARQTNGHMAWASPVFLNYR